MLTFTLAISFDHFQFALIHGPDIPGSYAILLFTASDLASLTSHIHSWVLFLLWLHPFILSGVIAPLISSSTYWPGEFLFQYPIILPFHTIHVILKARILKWFPFPFTGDHILSDFSTMLIHLGWPHRAWLSLLMLKASGGDAIPVELFQILKDDAVKYASKFGKLSSGHRTGKGQFSFQSQRKEMPKNAQTTSQLHSSHTLVK